MSDDSGDEIPFFAQKIQELTRKTGETQAELARRCGMGRDTYNRYYSGVTRPPAKRLLALARLFSVDPLDIDPDADPKDLSDAGVQVESTETRYKLDPPRNGDPSDIHLFVDCDLPIAAAFRVIDLINREKLAGDADLGLDMTRDDAV